RAVRGAEENGLGGELPDAAAGADRLVVDADVGMALGVFREPLRIDRIGERRARAVDLVAAAARIRGGRSLSGQSRAGLARGRRLAATAGGEGGGHGEDGERAYVPCLAKDSGHV